MLHVRAHTVEWYYDEDPAFVNHWSRKVVVGVVGVWGLGCASCNDPGGGGGGGGGCCARIWYSGAGDADKSCWRLPPPPSIHTRAAAAGDQQYFVVPSCYVLHLPISHLSMRYLPRFSILGHTPMPSSSSSATTHHHRHP